MRIGFADFYGMDFHALSVEQAPMGGSQSATCYLARALAHAGHEVFLINHISPASVGKYDGVTSLAWKQTGLAELRALNLDVLVNVMLASNVLDFRYAVGPDVKLILWNHHLHDHPDIQPLSDPGAQAAFDGFAMVSQWQREQYIRQFHLDPARTAVLRNAIAPAFANLFPNHTPILPEKSGPPILTYTSTPFRGLNLLLDALPAIRAAIPGTRLEVFSSMKVYQFAPEKEQAQYGALYQRCRETAGVEYCGSIAQPELAQRLRRVTMLAYPNTYPETSCIVVMEALAAGCHVVTSHLGALPETTAGFAARLIPVGNDAKAYLEQFIAQIISTLQDSSRDSAANESLLRSQIDKVNAELTWKQRAAEWQEWLERLPTST